MPKCSGAPLADPAARRLDLARRPWLRRGLRGAGYGPEWLGVLRYFSAQSRPATVFAVEPRPPGGRGGGAHAAPMGSPRGYTAHNIVPHESRPWQQFLRQLYQAVDHVVVQSVSGQKALAALMAGRQDIWSTQPTLSPGGDKGKTEPSSSQRDLDEAARSGIARRTSVIAMPADTVADRPIRQEARRQLGLPLAGPIVLFFGHVRPTRAWMCSSRLGQRLVGHCRKPPLLWPDRSPAEPPPERALMRPSRRKASPPRSRSGSSTCRRI